MINLRMKTSEVFNDKDVPEDFDGADDEAALA
jgi:hypothetical protein